jgi:HEAT repeat protein
MSNPESAKHIQALKDKSRNVRLSAVTELAKSGDASVIPALIKAVQDREYDVCAAATLALVDMGAPAVRALGKTLAMENGIACQNVAETLVKRGVSAVPALIEALKYDEAQHYATTALREIGELASLPRQVLSCRELSPQQRIDTLDAMRRIGRNRRAFREWSALPDVPQFCQQVLDEGDADAREEARVVLNWLEGGNQLLRGSQPDNSTQAQELLRGASPTDSTTAPDELLRADPSPNAEIAPPAPKEQKRRGPFARFRRHDA